MFFFCWFSFSLFLFLKYNNQEISWQHLINLYEWDLGMRRFASGWKLLHKLTEDYIALTPRHRMRVNLAAQVIQLFDTQRNRKRVFRELSSLKPVFCILVDVTIEEY